MFGWFKNRRFRSEDDLNLLVQHVPVLGVVPEHDNKASFLPDTEVAPEYGFWLNGYRQTDRMSKAENWEQPHREEVAPRNGESAHEYVSRLRGSDKIFTTLTEPTRSESSLSIQIARFAAEVDRLSKRLAAFERQSVR